jgi:hypothetical protein
MAEPLGYRVLVKVSEFQGIVTDAVIDIDVRDADDPVIMAWVDGGDGLSPMFADELRALADKLDAMARDWPAGVEELHPITDES